MSKNVCVKELQIYKTYLSTEEPVHGANVEEVSSAAVCHAQ